ncbi:hypothetical protein [Microbacterium sp.]|uniref:hypothetical protein n=1 Tax=Microbacterium sp. TaxID=51671 RepID=UPI002FE0D3BB
MSWHAPTATALPTSAWGVSHRIRLKVPAGVTAVFDESIQPSSQIENELVVGRFTTSRPISRFDVVADLTGVAVGPEVRDWADFTLNGRSPSLWDRMTYTEIFIRSCLESMAAFSNIVPPGG